MKHKLLIDASLEGIQGERLLIHNVKGKKVLMTVEDGEDITQEWYTLRYEVVDDDVYNQSVVGISLPYVVYKKDVYSVDDFHEWKRG